MKNYFLANQFGWALMLFLGVIPIILSSLLFLILGFHWINYLYSLIVPLLIITFVLIFRKFFFLKININENGLYTFYNSKIYKQIKWKEITYIEITNRKGIIISKDDEKNTKNLYRNLDNFIVFHLTKKNTKILLNYINNINIEIKGRNYL